MADQDVPDFVARARREHGERAAEELEKEAREALRNAKYPTPDCIKPYELELQADGVELPADRLAHAADCILCRRLMRAAKPPGAPPLPALESHTSPALRLPTRSIPNSRAIPASAPPPVPAAGGSGSSWLWFSPRIPAYGLAAALLIAVAASLLVPHDYRPPLTIPTDPLIRQSIAVLPMTVDKTAPEGVEAAIPEQLSRTIEELPNTTVHGPLTATAKTLTKASAQEIAREIPLDFVLNTRVSGASGKLNVRAEMVRASTGATLWARSYSTTLHALSTFNTSLAEDVSRELRPTLTFAQTQKFRRLLDTIDTDDGENSIRYVLATAAWNEREKPGFDKAIQLFSRILNEDPKYAPAHAGLATVYALQGNYGLSPRLEAFAAAEQAARQALQLAPELAEAHASMGLVNVYRRRWFDAEQGFRRAAELNPNYALAHRWHANLLLAFERFAEARSHIDRVLAIDPLSRSSEIWKSVTLTHERRPDEAIERLRALLARPTDARIYSDAPDWQIHLTLGQALEQSGRVEEAIRELETARQLQEAGGKHPPAESVLASLAHAYASAGQKEQALALLDRITAIPDHSLTTLALVHAVLGDHDRAFALLDQAYERFETELLLIRVESWFNPLRRDRRFDRLVNRMGLGSSTTT